MSRIRELEYIRDAYLAERKGSRWCKKKGWVTDKDRVANCVRDWVHIANELQATAECEK